MQTLTYIPLACWALSVGCLCLGTWLTCRHFKQSQKTLRPQPLKLLEPVTLLKPIKGDEEGLEENLHSFFQLDYPEFELIFSVAEPEDPSIPIIEKVLAAYPQIPAHLVIGEVALGPNPKINNLIRGYESAQFDWILISDSNIRAEPDYLKVLMEAVEDNTGVLTATVVGSQPKGLGGQMEAQHLNTFVARWMNLTESLGHPLVLGKSMLFRRSVMERIGGLKTLSQFLAEDYMAGRAVEKLGLKIGLLRQPVKQYLGKYSIRSFWSRHLRWGRMRKSHNRLTFLLEPFANALGSGMLGAYGMSSLLETSMTLLLGIHLLAWSLMDVFTHWRLGIRPKVFGPLYGMLKEFLILMIWFHTLCGNRIVWRGKKYQLLSGGALG